MLSLNSLSRNFTCAAVILATTAFFPIGKTTPTSAQQLQKAQEPGSAKKDSSIAIITRDGKTPVDLVCTKTLFSAQPHPQKAQELVLVNNDGPIVTISRDGKTIVDLNAAAAADTTKPIEILRATYGPPNDPAGTRDATDAVRQLVAEGQREIEVSDITKRVGDPKVGVVKTLTIEFAQDGKKLTASAKDSGTAFLGEATPVTAFASDADAENISFNFHPQHPSGLLLRGGGKYKLTATNDTAETIVNFSPAVSLAPYSLDGEWTVNFPDKEVRFPALTSWHKSADPAIKYFSGTATYRTTFRLPKSFDTEHWTGLELDLGKVHEFAEVILDGKNLGVLWKSEKKIDVTEALSGNGEHTLEIRVTNLWPNRLIGDQFIPAPGEARKPDGTLKRWPDWLYAGKKDPSGRQTFSMWNLWKKTDALIPSGLIGPVRLVPTQAGSLFFTPPTISPALAAAFAKPAPENRPWVYWFWNNGNLTKEGVTADLEAMAATGIGGVLIMDVGQGAPRGPVQFLSDEWREIFRFAVTEAARLGIEINMNNDAGWNGSGGTWIKPEHGMQNLTWTQTRLTGPATVERTLAAPPTQYKHYREVAVLAFPTPAKAAAAKAPSHDRQRRATAPGNATIARKDILDISAFMDASGTLRWEVPAGDWTILRIGHTVKNKRVHPAPEGADGLECDKLSVAASEDAFNGQIGRLALENKDNTGPKKVFVSTHIDSWENGSQTWTPLMRTIFKDRLHFDILDYLPVFAGYIVDSADITDRFLWDFRRVISDTILQNHVGTFKRLAAQHGLRLSVEAYDQSPADFLEFAGMTDEPIGEFWMGGSWVNSNGWRLDTCRGMASAGHVYGRNIIGAEAFTSANAERWLLHPGKLKATGDRAFAAGINRFIFHRYSFQPWKDVKPGLMMGPWGIHYERTQTWWHLTPAWHEYLTRCQFMLRQGNFPADIAYLEPEDSPQGFTKHATNRYQWDQLGLHAINDATVKDGKIVLASGASYSVLVLPKTKKMTEGLLLTIHRLVQNGATVVADVPPVGRPTLFNYEVMKDAHMEMYAGTLWGFKPAAKGETVIGKGRFIWGTTPEAVLAAKGIVPDFVATHKLSQLHRRSAEADIYFVANPAETPVLAQATFRATGRPEIWHPESGKRIVAPVYLNAKNGTTTVLLPFGPTESYFVVFPR